jgi:manganese/zinc/iron transport system ATP- binding protein
VNDQIIRFHDVTVRYGRRPALEGITAQIPCNSLTALLGPNGAGKSTLLRSILGWHPMERGEIRIGDSHAHHTLPRLAYLPQRAEVDWDFPITVEEVVRQGRYPALGPFRRFGPEDARRVEEAIEEMGLGEMRDRQIRALSVGQQQRVFLARALAQGADIFLLDEPFAALDPQATADLAQQLRQWERQGRTVLAAVHDLPLAAQLFSRAVLLRQRLIAAGPIAEALTPETLRATFGPDVAMPLLREPEPNADGHGCCHHVSDS